MHLTSSPVDWYAARAAGIVAYLLLSAGVALGVGLAGRKRLERWPRFALEDVHRFLGLLTGTFLAIHVVTVAIDAFLPFSLTQLVVPFTDRYRPLWVGLGIAAAELLLALAVTNRLRGRLSHRVWRRAHYLNFAVWLAASAHGLASGTDRSAAWFVALYAVATAGVSGLAVQRLVHRALPALTAAALAAGLVAALALGPLSFHRRVWNAVAFREPIAGKILVSRGVTRGIVSMAGNGSGTQRVLVRADLLVEPNRLAATAFQLEYLPSGTVCRGTVSSVRATGFDASCTLPSGARRFVTASWTLTGEEGSLSGEIAAHA